SELMLYPCLSVFICGKTLPHSLLFQFSSLLRSSTIRPCCGSCALRPSSARSRRLENHIRAKPGTKHRQCREKRTYDDGTDQGSKTERNRIYQKIFWSEHGGAHQQHCRGRAAWVLSRRNWPEYL